MKKWLILAVVLAAALIGGYRWYAEQPEQKVNAVVDLFFDAVEYDTAVFRQRSDVHDAMREVLTETIYFQGQSPLPEGQVGHERIFSQLDLTHSVTTLREFTELDRAIVMSGSEAEVTRTCEIKFVAMNQFSGSQTWKIIFNLELDEEWRINAIRGENITE